MNNPGWARPRPWSPARSNVGAPGRRGERQCNPRTARVQELGRGPPASSRASRTGRHGVADRADPGARRQPGDGRHRLAAPAARQPHRVEQGRALWPTRAQPQPSTPAGEAHDSRGRGPSHPWKNGSPYGRILHRSGRYPATGDAAQGVAQGAAFIEPRQTPPRAPQHLAAREARAAAQLRPAPLP